MWVLLQPLFYALRPVITYPKPPTPLELVNTTVQMSFNVAVGYFLGEGSGVTVKAVFRWVRWSSVR